MYFIIARGAGRERKDFRHVILTIRDEREN